MNLLLRTVGFAVSLPARLKGMKFGKNAFIGPGYDCMFVDLSRVQVGDNVQIGRGAWLQTVEQGFINIKGNTSIGRNVTISAKKGVTVGENCLFSYGVSLIDHNHEFRNLNVAPIHDGLTEGKEIVVGDDCFIGARSFLLQGVNLGRHCVVGANSVVTKSFPEHSVIGGNPAKLIKTLQ